MRLRECERDRGVGQGSAQGVLCALSAAYGYAASPGRDRCVRAEALVAVCGSSRDVAVVRNAVPRRAIVNI